MVTQGLLFQRIETYYLYILCGFWFLLGMFTFYGDLASYSRSLYQPRPGVDYSKWFRPAKKSDSPALAPTK